MTGLATPCAVPDGEQHGPGGYECSNPRHHHWTSQADWESGHDRDTDPFPMEQASHDPVDGWFIPMLCEYCRLPAHYDYGDDAYHHDDPAAPGCFLIPAVAR